MTQTHHPTDDRVISRSDRFGLIAFIAAGVVIAAWSVVSAVRRIVEVAPNRDVAVTGIFDGTPGTAPIGPDGAPVAVGLKEATLTVPQLPTASLWAIYLQQIVVTASIVTLIACLILLARAVLSARVFTKRNTRLVTIAGIAGIVGLTAHSFFGNMAANGAFARLSDRTFDNTIMTVDVSTLLLAACVSGLVSAFFAVGQRLQRDAEGLV